MKQVLIVLTFLLMISFVHAAGGGGGGSGGGSESDLSINAPGQSISNNIKEDNAKTIKLSTGETYSFTIRNLTGDEATFSFSGIDITVFFKDEQELDLNNDGTKDLKIHYLSYSGRTGRFVFTELGTIPEEEDKGEQEQQLSCGAQATIQERVQCRPLEEKPKQVCIINYEAVQPCWKQPIGKERIQCVRERLQDVVQGNEQAYAVIKFRFYDLEERTEEFLEKEKSTTEDTVAFITALEQEKLNFNTAQTKEERKTIILNVRALWKEYVTKVER